MQISKSHREFIRTVANGVPQSEAYRATVGNPKATIDSVKSKASNLAKKYAQEIAEAQQLNKDIAEQANKTAIGKTQESRIISAARRMEILSDIAEGLIPLTKPMVCDGVIQEVPVVPDWMDRKNAIAELNKMTGDYSPTKIDTTIRKLGKELEEEYI